MQFRRDPKANRVGVLTTNDVKHAMSTLLNSLLREKRVHMLPRLVSKDPAGMRQRLREQLEVYSYQFKDPADTFGKQKVAISGKVGGMKDDICICLQLACYWTNFDQTERLLRGDN